MFGSSQWMYSSGGGFYDTEIDGSLRFNDNDSAYLSWTPPATHAAGRATYTFSCWFKISGGFGTNTRPLFGAGSTTWDMLYISSGDVIAFSQATETISNFRSNAVLRDPSAWYHIVLTVDTTEATDTNRVKCWLNGEQVTWSTSTYPSPQNETSKIADNVAHYIGKHPNASAYWDGYFGDMHFVSGQALDASSFGETKSGVWIPKAYSGSYGTNGFHLEFAGNANDSSGNGNNFTANNIGSWDYVPDSPTNNFCTLNPLQSTSSATLREGNLELLNGSNDQASSGTFGITSGKWYWEVYYPTNDCPEVGVMPVNQYLSNRGSVGSGTVDALARITNGTSMRDPSWASVTNTGLTAQTSFGTVRVVLDADNGKLWVSDLGGTYPNSGNPETGTNPQGTFDSDWVSQTGGVTPFALVATGTSQFCLFNFGQDSTFTDQTSSGGNSDANGYGDFKYSVPSGYLALCTANLTVAEAVDPAEDNSPQNYYNTVLYTGNGSTQSITGVGFQPDFVWGKERSSTSTPTIYDAIRGATKMLNSSGTDAESTVSNQLTSFDSDGFSLGNSGGINENNQTYVAWNWKANGSGVSNTDGSITSTVSANTESGFSIATYSGTGANATVGHGLSQAPEMFICKSRDFSESWAVYHKDVGNTKQLILESTTTPFGPSSTYWNNTSPTSSVVSFGSDGKANGSGHDYVMYAFHSVEGFSRFSSYQGNGSTDGVFVYTGFRPYFVMVKSYTSGEHWNIPVFTSDANGTVNTLSPNLSNAERTMDQNPAIDFVSNGFKIRTSDANYNSNGGSYIYMAFAENPFKYANAR